MNEDFVFIEKIIHHFERVKEVHGSFNFRCPYCGDSQKDERKARGWLNQTDSGYFFHCFNCQKSNSFYGFLKDFFPQLAASYHSNKFLSRGRQREKSSQKVEKRFFDDSDFVLLKHLDSDHRVFTFLEKRKVKLSKKHLDDIYFSSKRERIFFPLRRPSGYLMGYQGRDITGKSDIRYLTKKIDPRWRLSYGLNFLDREKTIIVTEGIFDALFFRNSIAALCSDLSSIVLKEELPKERVFLLFDNEPRNEQIVSMMEKAVANDLNLIFWKKSSEELGGKDVNDVVKTFGRKVLKESLEFSDSKLKSMLLLSRWRKL